MKKKLTYLCSMLLIALIANSCKKDESGNGVKAVFSYVADGFKVNFTNFSTNATEYVWDFGDGSGVTSTSKAPQHIFKSKGDFLVSLTAKNGAETSTFIDSVSIIGPNIKIDGDFSDWEYVEYSHTNEAGTGGTLTGLKTFASSTHLNFYLEGTTDMKMEIVDIYVDADNNPSTAFSTWQYPAGAGAEFLFEGSFSGGWGDMFAHAGNPADFSFSPIMPFADVLSHSAIKTVSGKKIVEFSIKRDKLGTTRTAVNFAIIESTSGWAPVGSIPVNATPESKFARIVL